MSGESVYTDWTAVEFAEARSSRWVKVIER
jgi:hypothetical protein